MLASSIAWNQACRRGGTKSQAKAESESMTLHISEAEVRAVLSMPMALKAVDEISRKQATGEVVVHPRRRFELPGGGFFHYMAAADYSSGFLAMKQYTYVRGELRFLVPLYEMPTGDLLAVMTAGAYGAVQAGTYNTRPLIPEVLVRDGEWALVRPRLEADQLIGLDKLPPWL
jgi:hypothetical protein